MSVVIDCTELYENPIRTGIQRVVREVLRHWPANGPELHVARFDPERGLVRLPAATVHLLTDADPNVEVLPHGDLIRCLQLSADGIDAGPLPADGIVFIPEVFYNPARCRFHEKRLAERPGSLALLLYDFLPFLQPGVFRLRSAAPLMHYLRLARLASHVAYISEKTRQDYGRVVRGRGSHGPVLPLGADGLRIERQTWRLDRRSFVALGSLDGRKNQDLVAAAFVRLWETGHDLPLTIVGRAFEGLDLGWITVARQFPNFRWLEGASDGEVRQVLHEARATIYMSETEGFGLPPVESLAAGIPAIVAASCPSVAMLPSVGLCKLDRVTPDRIAAAVMSLAEDTAAAVLWAEAASVDFGTWQNFAAATARWLGGQEVQTSPKPRLAGAPRCRPPPPACTLFPCLVSAVPTSVATSQTAEADRSEERLQENLMEPADMFSWWNGAALDNPMTAILSNDQNWNPAAFFETGRAWLAEHRAFAASANVDVKGRRALDFGCGVGRMTAALAEFYETAVGIDISEEMVRLARQLQRHTNAEFVQALQPPLPFPDRTFDCIYSTIVIQHIPPPYNIQYVREFFRLSDEMVLFDAPSRQRPAMQPGAGIFMLDLQEVLTCAADAGFELMALRDFPATASRQYQYLFRRIS